MNKHTFLSMFSALAAVIAIALFAMLAAPVAKPLAWALIIGISTMPHHNRLLHRFPGKPGRAAGLMVLAVTICFILPTAGLVITAAVNATDWYKQVEQLVVELTRTGTTTLSRIPVIDKIIAMGQEYGIDLAGIGARIASGASGTILNMATEAAKNVFTVLFTLAVALFILFFIYRDGERTVTNSINRFAANKQRAEHYVSEIRSITTAVTVGTILTCAAQGVIAGIGYYFAGVPAPIFCGTLTAIAALLPVVGTAIIWVPLVGLVALNGEYLTAGLLALWCIFFVGLADNAIRPFAIGANRDIPVLAVVLGAICGVVTLGLLGLILGPVLFVILVTIWDDVVADVKQS